MWSRVLGCAGIVASLVLLPALVQAQDATPIGDTVPLDLTAMVLFPTDIEGGTFSLALGGFFDPAVLVTNIASRTGKTEAQVQSDIDGFGFDRSYSLLLAEPWPDNVPPPAGVENPWGKTIESAVAEYPSAEDAAAAFAYLERETEDAGLIPGYLSEEDQPLEMAIGDEAELTVATALATDTQDPYTSLNLTFRDGNLIGDLYVKDFTAEELSIAEIEGLAMQLLARMEEGRNGELPDLGQRVLRFPGPAYEDFYTRIDGIDLPRFAEPAEETAAAQARSTALAFYSRDQDIDGAVQPSYVLSQVGVFPLPAGAATYQLDGPQLRLAEDPMINSVEAVAGAPTVGDASDVFHYTYADDSDFAGWSGYGIAAISGPYLVVMYVEQQGGGVSLETALGLVELQFACLTEGPCPEVQPAPASLLEPVATPVAQATPAA